MVSKCVMAPLNKTFQENGSRGKTWMKPTDQMDLYLDSQGYYRKHTAKDGSCLYRVISEQIFLAQAFHLDVRRQCAEFAQRHPEMLKSVNHCSASEYVEHMKHPYESGGKLELHMMSLMYRKEFSVFSEIGKRCEPVTNNGFKDNILLCLSQDRHYDSVFTKQYIATSAFCQSLVYEMLYKKVFELLEVDYAVKKMLHDKTSKYPKDPSSFLLNGLAVRLEIRDSYVNVKELLNLGVTPFPYKVAKSLDPDIYRNVEYDTWNDLRRGIRYGAYLWNNQELQVGVKCHVKIEPNQICLAHIQEMAPNKGPVLVYVEELGQKMTVPYENLEVLPQPPQPPQLPLHLKHLKQLQAIRALAAVSQESPIIEGLDERDESKDALTICESEKDHSVRSELETDGKMTPKLKMFSEISKYGKKLSKPYMIKSKENQHHQNIEHIKSKMDTTSIISSNDCTYQDQESLGYHHHNFEDYNCHEYSNQDMSEEPMEEESVPHYVSPPTCSVESQQFYYQQPTQDTYPTFCFTPPKPAACEHPDMPVTDIGPVRFYCNYGFDFYSRSFRPAPPCYFSPTVAFVPDTNISPAVYSTSTSPTSTPDSAVVVSPANVYPQRPDSLPILPASPSIEPGSTNFNMHNIAPRFKNKQRAAQGRPFELPVIQQAEVSSTTNVPLATHYMSPVLPPPPPLPQPQPPQAATVYHPPTLYHPVECETYFPTTYSLYDPITGVFYPHSLTLAPTQPHFVHPDSAPLFYQQVIPAPQ